MKSRNYVTLTLCSLPVCVAAALTVRQISKCVVCLVEEINPTGMNCAEVNVRRQPRQLRVDYRVVEMGLKMLDV